MGFSRLTCVDWNTQHVVPINAVTRKRRAEVAVSDEMLKRGKKVKIK